MLNEFDRRARKRTWQENAKTIELYHLRQLLEHLSWSERKTARELNRSIGSVSEDLRLSLALRIYPEVSEFKTREEALDYLKRKKKCHLYTCNTWSGKEIEGIITDLDEQVK